MRRLLILSFLTLLLSSHELFLKSDSYFLDSNSLAELYLFNGTFDESENVITRDRIISPTITGPNYEFKPAESDYYDREKVTYLKFKTGSAGTYVAGVSTRSRIIELSGKEFTDYLEHEGLTRIIAERKNMGITNDTAREEYSKHVKAILQVDDHTSDHFSTELGYPIEFIPLQNPYGRKVGDEIKFRLLYLGQPLSNQTVHISSRRNSKEKGKEENTAMTDQNGEFSFTIGNQGQWYVATIHMEEAEEADLDYRSNWATLTFGVR